MQFATYDYLTILKRDFNESALIKNASVLTTAKNVFLSHSSQDKHLLPSVISILKAHGGMVYVDSDDIGLPSTTNRKTAETLRTSVKTCRRFVLFVTANSKDSKWIPWELGLADGEKDEHSVALFPSAEKASEQRWSQVEYLGLYQRIVWGRIQYETPEDTWIVWDYRSNTAETLKNWLKEK